MAECVLVTEAEYEKGEEVFSAVGDVDLVRIGPAEQLLADTILDRGVRAVIIGHNRYEGPLYTALGRTGADSGALLARFGVGHDGLDKAQTRTHGIAVTNTPGTLDASVAEHVFWLLGCLVKQVARLDTQFRAGQFAGHTGLELYGRTLGLVGFGGIARHVARIAHFGLGMRVLACGRRSGEELAMDHGRLIGQILDRFGVAQYTTDADTVFRESDVISIHLPAQADTRGFVDARRLALLKPAAWLINTSRGSVADESALYDALRSGRLAGAGLDVFHAEPYVPVAPDKDLRQLDNVVLTPHVGSNTHAANRRMAEASLANVRAFFAGRWDELTRVDG
jgi:lactate dehydrogenase-like 2-hydroxyacid dehydrogenase